MGQWGQAFDRYSLALLQIPLGATTYFVFPCMQMAYCPYDPYLLSFFPFFLLFSLPSFVCLHVNPCYDITKIFSSVLASACLCCVYEFTCVWVHVCRRLFENICACVCGDLELMLGVFPYYSPLYLLSQGFLLELTDSR